MFATDGNSWRTAAALIALAGPALLLTACNDDPLFDLPPEQPTNVTAAVQDQSVTIAWEPGTNATSQEVRVSPVVAVPASAGNALQADDLVQVFNDNTTNTALFEDLEPGPYTATVTAINASARVPSDPEPFTIAGSASVPVITSVAVAEGDPTTVIVEWTGVEGAENYQVSLTADDDTGDFSEIAGASATSFPFSPVNPGTTYTAEVCLFTQGGGVGECGATVDYTVPVNAAPVAAITAPANLDEFFNTELITFTGTGTDAEDGELTGESLAWSSDLDGPLGTGEELLDVDASTVSLGAHLITLTATDSEDATGEAAVIITINEATSAISFPDDIQAYLGDTGANCTSCHQSGGVAASIPLVTWEDIVRGTGSGGESPLIVIGDATMGVLIPQLATTHGGGPADAATIESYETWVNDGAPDNTP
jgi:hypothetical protein